MATEASGDARCGIGARLRSARERLGLTILQAAEKVHADPRVLEALEAERFDELGAPVFVRGHIRRYAELVRENPTELQDLYSASTHAGAKPDLTRIPHTSGARPADTGKLLVPGVIMVIGVGLVGLIWWFMTDLRAPAPPSADQPERVESAASVADSRQPQPLDAPTPPIASTTGATNDRAGANRDRSGAAGGRAGATTASSGAAGGRVSTNTSASAATTAANTSNATASSSRAVAPGSTSPGGQQQSVTQNGPATTLANSGSATGSTTPAASADSNSTGASGTASPDTASAGDAGTTAQTQPARAADGNELTLRFSGDSWAEIYDARGNRLFYDIGSADSVKTLSGSPPYRVVLGNPGGVAVEVNGKSARVPKVRGGESGIQFTINKAGRVSKARAAPNAGG